MRFTSESNPPSGVTVTFEVAVVSGVKLTELTAAIVKSGAAEVVNANVAVALCLIPPEVPKIVTSWAPGTLEVHEIVASPELFGIAAGWIAVHKRSVGRVRSDRATFPVKPLRGLTRMIDVARVVPSAGTTLGGMATSVKSGIGIELNVQRIAPSDSVPCSDTIRENAKLSTNNSNRTLLSVGGRLIDFPNIPNKLRQGHDGKMVPRPLS